MDFSVFSSWSLQACYATIIFTIWIAPAMQDLHLVQSDILDGICSAMSRHVGKQMAKYNTFHVQYCPQYYGSQSWCIWVVWWHGARGWHAEIIAGGAHFTDKLWQWRWRHNCPQGPHWWRHNHVEEPEHILVIPKTWSVVHVHHSGNTRNVECGNRVKRKKTGSNKWKV